MLDYIISSFLVLLRTPFLNSAFVFFSFIGDFAFVWLLIGIVIFFKKHYYAVSIYFIVGLLTFILNELLLKNLFMRERPFVVYDTIEPLVHASGYSLPSSHAATSFAFAMIISYFYPCKRTLVFVLAGLISFSRVYVGVHYFSDVLMGAIVGLAVARLMIRYLVYTHKNTVFDKEVK